MTYHGTVPNGENILPNVQLETIYIGNQWASGTLAQYRTALDAYARALVGGPFMSSLLSQYWQYVSDGYSGFYDNVGAGTFEGSVYDPVNTYQGQVLNDDVSSIANNDYRPPSGDIENFLASELDTGNLTAWNNFDNLYLVVLPPGVSSAFCIDTQAGGYHSSFFWQTGWDGSTPVGNQIHYAVVPWPDPAWSLTQEFQNNYFDVLTTVISHEVAEAVTDPEYYQFLTADGYSQTSGGWFANDGSGEVGDKAEGYYGLYDGYVIQAIWSNLAGSPALPPGAQWLTAGIVPGSQPAVTDDYVNQIVIGPSASGGWYSTQEGGRLVESALFGLLSLSSDVFKNPLSAMVSREPLDGTLTVNLDGSFVYTPNPGFTGTDSFTYTVTDGTFRSAPATVTINVTPSPTSTPPTPQSIPPSVLGITGIFRGRKKLAEIQVIYNEFVTPLTAGFTLYRLPPQRGRRSRNPSVPMKVRSVQFLGNTALITLARPIKASVQVDGWGEVMNSAGEPGYEDFTDIL